MTMTTLFRLRNIRRCLPAMCLLLAVVNCPTRVQGQSDDIPDQAPPLAPPEQFPVFPWDVIKPTKAAYQEAKACGFNLAGFVHVEDLDTVRDAGLKCFVSDPSINIRGTAADGSSGLSDDQINAAVKDLVARTAKHPAVFGYHIIDEPSRKLVPTVARWAKAFLRRRARSSRLHQLLPHRLRRHWSIRGGLRTLPRALSRRRQTQSLQLRSLFDAGRRKRSTALFRMSRSSASSFPERRAFRSGRSCSAIRTFAMPSPASHPFDSRCSPPWHTEPAASAGSPTPVETAETITPPQSTCSATARPPGTCCAM